MCLLFGLNSSTQVKNVLLSASVKYAATSDCPFYLGKASLECERLSAPHQALLKLTDPCKHTQKIPGPRPYLSAQKLVITARQGLSMQRVVY